MIATWLGHSCFCLVAESGVVVILDPFLGEEVGYPFPRIRSDIVAVSHEHPDHNNVAGVSGHPQVIRGPGIHEALGIRFLGVKSSHDDAGGSERGQNTIFCFTLDAIRICHLGDIGEPLRPTQVDAIGPVDLLFLPVGGRYTIDAVGAGEVMRQLHPIVAVPMHYQTANLGFELDRVYEFLRGRKVRGPMKFLQMESDDLPENGRVALLSCPAAGVADGSID
jgi:L-ascorbate metabolism protein UlaG (beta-lactamase superfamily)